MKYICTTILIITFAYHHAFTQTVPLSPGFVTLGEKFPANLTRTENAVMINYFQGGYGMSSTEPTFDEISSQFINDLNQLGIEVSVCVDHRAFNLPEIKDAFYDELRKISNPNIISLMLMCGNRNGRDFCSFLIMVGPAAKSHEYMFEDCAIIYQHAVADYNNLLSDLKKALKRQGMLKNSPVQSHPKFLSINVLNNNVFYSQLPDDFQNDTLLIQKYEEIALPEKVPDCITLQQINAIKSFNSEIDKYNKSYEDLMKRDKGNLNYRFVGFDKLSEYYGKEGYYLLSVIQSTNSEIKEKYVKKGSLLETHSPGPDTRIKKDLKMNVLFYLLLKDMKTGAQYFMNYNNGISTWEECIKTLAKMSRK